MGLSVRNVGYSNDGGVDFIASCDTPIFKGTYIIQCKNWQENVGQPIVCDLYGVIMDRRANKGIVLHMMTVKRKLIMTALITIIDMIIFLLVVL